MMNEREQIKWWITNETADKVIDQIIADRKRISELEEWKAKTLLTDWSTKVAELEADNRNLIKAHDEMLEQAQKRISELEELLRRAYQCMNDWQDPMVAPFERIMNDIDPAIKVKKS